VEEKLHSNWFLINPIPETKFFFKMNWKIVTFSLLLGANLTCSRVIQNSDILSKSFYQGSSSIPAFTLRFRCTPGNTPEACKKAEKAFSRACERVLSEFRIARTIVIDLTYFLPCGQKNPDASCPERNKLGSAVPTTRIPVRHRDDNQLYLYPSALLKQQDFEGVDQVKWPEADVTARFNSLTSWYFPEDGVAMNDSLRDFEATATHELLHGLGYGDDLIYTYRPERNLTLLMPYVNTYPGEYMGSQYETTTIQPHNFIAITQFTAPSIWNRFTYMNGKLASDYAHTFRDIFNRIKGSNVFIPFPGEPRLGMPSYTGQYTAESVITALRGDQACKTLMEQLYKEATTANALEFRTGSWPPNSSLKSTQILETGIAFSEGSTASHVSVAANNTAEFLMIYANGAKLLSTLITNNKAPASGIGPITKDVLVALGYSPSNGDILSRRQFGSVDPSARSSSAIQSFKVPQTVMAGMTLLYLLMQFA
jgi:hypothetical protein